MTQQLCPEPTMLAAFGRGELAEELFEQIATHVVDCSSCQRALAQLGDGSDALLAGLRHVRGKDAATPCPDTHPTQHNNSSQASAVSTPPGYELLGEVGRGGMGMVQRARDTRLNREVAVKLLREDYPADSAVCARFNDHPNTLVCLRSLAVAYCESKQSEKALPLFAEYFEGIRSKSSRTIPVMSECWLPHPRIFWPASVTRRQSCIFANAKPSARSHSRMIGARSMPNRCWAELCWARKNTRRPSRYCSRATKA